MKITILDRKSMGDDLPFHILDSFGEVISYDGTSDEELLSHVSDSDVIILNKNKITDAVISNSSKLRLICVFATGYDNVDVESARRHGVAVCNVPGYSTDSVALFTVATVLSLVTHMSEYSEYVRCGEYSKSGIPNKIFPTFHELRGKTWGIVGFGNIGKAVAKVAEAFETKVIVNKRTKLDGYTCVDIDTLCKESDIITLHCPLTEETRGIISAERISLMKRDAILVNSARGAVINEKDMAEAIKNGKIGAFGCDVYSEEPMSEKHPYYEIKDFKNVILTPHSAWGAYDSRARCLSVIRDNISSYMNGETLNRVDLIK